MIENQQQYCNQMQLLLDQVLYYKNSLMKQNYNLLRKRQ